MLAGGLVQTSSFAVLPNITPGMTLGLVILGMAPCLLHTWRKPSPGSFTLAATHACLTSFLLGFHVHEKAILMATVPLGILTAHDHSNQSSGSHLLDDIPPEGASSEEPPPTATATRLSEDSFTAAANPREAQQARKRAQQSTSEQRVAAGMRQGKDSQANGRSQMAQSVQTSDSSGGDLMEDYIVLATAGHYGLLPLLFTLQEYPIKASHPSQNVRSIHALMCQEACCIWSPRLGILAPCMFLCNV